MAEVLEPSLQLSLASLIFLQCPQRSDAVVTTSGCCGDEVADVVRDLLDSANAAVCSGHGQLPLVNVEDSRAEQRCGTVDGV